MNLKKHYQSLNGQKVSQDYFLFHCLYAENELSQAIKSQSDLVYSDWESLKTSESFSASLDSLVLFYKEQHKNLFLDKTLDYIHCADFVSSFVALKHDLEKLQKLPKTAVKSCEEKEVQEEAVTGEDAENQEPAAVENPQKEISPNEIVEKMLQENFPQSYFYMANYLSWADKKRKPREDLDYTVVPPIGRYLQRVKREFSNLFSTDSGSSFDSEKRYGSRDFSSSKSHKEPRLRQQTSPEEKQALEEVESAIKKLEKSPGIKVITLKSCDSSLRMLQHKRISKSEFVSHSFGESPNRAIQIKRT
jgi:hypothetical protein